MILCEFLMYIIALSRKLNKYLKFGIVFLAVYCSAIVNLSAQVLLTEEEKAWITANPVIKAGNNTINAPFDFVVAGQPAGFSVDYLELLAKKVGLKIDHVNFRIFSDVFNAGVTGEVDIIHSLSKNSRREELMLFSDGYTEISVKSYGQIGSNRINAIDDLVGKRIGILKENFVSDAYRKNYPELNLIDLANYREAVQALSNNEVDVFTGDAATIEYYIALDDIENLTVIGDGEIVMNESFFKHFAVLKDKKILIDILHKAMASVTDAEFEEISEKWIDTDVLYHQNNIPLSDAELNWLANNPVIITVAGSDNAPSAFINSEGKIDGIAGDYLNEISNRLNVDFVWAANESWNDGLEKLLSTEADIVVGASSTPRREEFLTFSAMFLTYDTAIYSRTDGIRFANLESLRGYTVVQVAGTANIDYLKEFYPDINIIEVDNLLGAILTLSNGGADAMTSDNLVASSAILKADVTNLIISGIAPYNFANGIGTRKDLPLLASAIDKAVADIPASRRQEIINKWTLLRFIPTTDYSYLWNVVIAGLFLLVIALIWNGKLTLARKQAVKSKQEAESANEAKTKFLANVSHELRTPLNSLLLLSQNLTKNNDNNLTDKQVDYINVIHNSGSELLHMVNDLLDLSKAEANKIVIKEDEINIQEMRNYLNQIFKPLMDEAGLDFSVTIDEKLPKTFVSDKQYLYQILKNLISNALKFTKEGAISVNFKSHSTQERNLEQIKFSVTDTGIGIDKDMQQKIFEEFAQGERNTDHNYGGTGLGLNISKRIANLMEGDITVSSKIGEGSIFNLFLPLSSDFVETFETEDLLIPSGNLPNTDNSNEVDEKDWGLEGTTLLLVDDDERNLYSLAEVLNKYGIISITAERGAKALEILKNNLDIELVLMDMMMPGMDGEEAISRIRFTLRGEKLPIIALTANAMPEHKEICLKAGANDYLTKPIHLETLLSKIREWL